MIQALPSLLLAALLLMQGYIVPGRPRPAAAGGDCTDFASLEVFYKGSDLGTVSAAISAWADSSGNGNDLSQGTGANQPVVATLGSGKGADFDGADVMDMDSSFSATGVYTIATVFNSDDQSGDEAIVGGPLAGTTPEKRAALLRVEADGGDNDSELEIRTEGPSITDISTANVITEGTTYIVVAGRDSSDEFWVYVDGTDVSAGNSDSNTIQTQTMGSTGNGTEDFTGIIGTTCIWLADHEASEQTIHDYLDTQH